LEVLFCRGAGAGGGGTGQNEIWNQRSNNPAATASCWRGGDADKSSAKERQRAAPLPEEGKEGDGRREEGREGGGRPTGRHRPGPADTAHLKMMAASNHEWNACLSGQVQPAASAGEAFK